MFRNKILHLISLLHAVSLQNLRTDFNLRNLIPHLDATAIPPFDAKSITKQHSYVEQHIKRLSAQRIGGNTHVRWLPCLERVFMRVRYRRFDTIVRSFMLNGSP